MPAITDKKELIKIGTSTYRILEKQKYKTSLKTLVSLKESLDYAVSNTILYSPGDLVEANESFKPAGDGVVEIEVTEETTSAAGKRILSVNKNVVVLNFASAKSPGGGFLNGARAQEEDLARKSGLYACLKPQSAYYVANKKCKSYLYTDHLIYSPKVPFFRDENLVLLDVPYLLSVITSPAPNVGEALQGDIKSSQEIVEVLERRTKDILLAAKINYHRCLILGAWGCGIFRNDPQEVSRSFLKHLKDPCFTGCFDKVTFAIYDLYPEKTLLKTFKQTFKEYLK